MIIKHVKCSMVIVSMSIKSHLVGIVLFIAMTSPDAKPMLSLCHDYDHYVRCLTEFENRSAWLKEYKIWVNSHLGQKVVDQLNAATLQEGEKLLVLGVGSGEGIH